MPTLISKATSNHTFTLSPPTAESTEHRATASSSGAIRVRCFAQEHLDTPATPLYPRSACSSAAPLERTCNQVSTLRRLFVWLSAQPALIGAPRVRMWNRVPECPANQAVYCERHRGLGSTPAFSVGRTEALCVLSWTDSPGEDHPKNAPLTPRWFGCG